MFSKILFTCPDWRNIVRNCYICTLMVSFLPDIPAPSGSELTLLFCAAERELALPVEHYIVLICNCSYLTCGLSRRNGYRCTYDTNSRYWTEKILRRRRRSGVPYETIQMPNIYYEHGEGISWRSSELLEYLRARVGWLHFVTVWNCRWFSHLLWKCCRLIIY
jgi:hypothetical protein